MKKIFKWMLLLAAFIFCYNQENTAQAGDNGKIELNDQWVEGKIPKEEISSYHTFTLEKDGWVAIKAQEQSGFWNKEACYDIQDSNGVSLFTTGMYDTEDRTLPLEAGTYKIVYMGVDTKDNYGKEKFYRLKLGFTNSGSTDSAGNNTAQQADTLSEGERMNGFFTLQDQMDFYKFQIDSPRLVNFTVSNGMNVDLTYTIYREDMSVIAEREVSQKKLDAAVDEYSSNFEAGVYYVKAVPESRRVPEDMGSYSISFSSKKLVSSIKINGGKGAYAGKSIQLSAEVQPADVQLKEVVWSLDNSDAAYIDETTGAVNLLKPGKVTVTAKAKDESGCTAELILYVKPAALDAPELDSKKKGQADVSFEGMQGVEGYAIQYSDKANMKKAKVSELTSSEDIVSKTILAKKGKKCYVRVRAYVTIDGKRYYGPWSGKTAINVKK